VAFVTILIVISHGADAGKIVSKGMTDEYQVKAAFIYNFVKFTQWPQTAFDGKDTPIRIAIVGPVEFGDAFIPFLQKPIRGRNIVVLRKKETESLNDCHVVFFSKPMHRSRIQPLSQLARLPVLTIGETPEFANEGGIVNFFNVNNTIRFEINRDVAEKAGLKISSKLLHLAKIVKRKKPTP
jgi:hypothetical protein